MDTCRGGGARTYMKYSCSNTQQCWSSCVSLIDAYFLFVVLLQAWEAISNKSPVMALQEHLSLQMLAATVVMAPLPPTKRAMDQMPMEVERILDEGPPMFLVDSIHTDAREL